MGGGQKLLSLARFIGCDRIQALDILATHLDKAALDWTTLKRQVRKETRRAKLQKHLSKGVCPGPKPSPPSFLPEPGLWEHPSETDWAPKLTSGLDIVITWPYGAVEEKVERTAVVS